MSSAAARPPSGATPPGPGTHQPGLGTTQLTGPLRPPLPSPPVRWALAAAVVLLVALLPLSDLFLSPQFAFAKLLPIVFAYAMCSLGLTVVTGFTGMLHLGVIAFMAIGVYTYAIATCPVYPFQVGFWPGLALAVGAGALAGVVLGLPTMRLRGDYLAIVTLGFGEITQDCLKNLEVVTKGTTGINPLPAPWLPGWLAGWLKPAAGSSGADYLPGYYVLLAVLTIAVLVVRNLKRSRTGRSWLAIREDELAARAMGIEVSRQKLAAFAVGAALCAAGGALFAAVQGSVNPDNYDFQGSVLVVASVIIGGLGSISGALLGALLIFGFNQIVLAKIAEALPHAMSSNVLLNPANWKCMVYGLALVLMMRFRAQGLLPPRDAG